LRKTISWLLVLILCTGMLSGCAGSRKKVSAPADTKPIFTTPVTDPTQPTEPVQIPMTKPTVIDLSVVWAMEVVTQAEESCYLEYPVLELGYLGMDGSIVSEQPLEGLAAALADYNQDVMTRQQQTALQLINDPQAAMPSLEVRAYVTRNDSQVVSFYEQITEQHDWGVAYLRYRAYTFDTQTGNQLTAQDVFMDPDALATTVTEALQQEFPDGAVEDPSQLTFALTPAGVRFFYEDLQVEIPHEGLVKPQYAQVPDSWMLKLTYDTYTQLDARNYIRLQWESGQWDDVLWTAEVNGVALTREYYGNGPDCYVICADGRYFLYVTVPAGDISCTSQVFEITQQGLVPLGEPEMSIWDKTSLNPQRIAMSLNEISYPGNFLLQTWGWFSLDEEGMPLLLSGFGVLSRPLMLNCSLELRNTFVDDPTAHAGTSTVYQGQLLTPFRTDMLTYLDFLDEAGNAYRLEIENYGDEMIAPGYPTMEEMFS